MEYKKPQRLKPDDTVAVVSLSWGGLGEPELIHKLDIAKKRLEEEFKLKVKVMPHALKGSQFVYEHPELRAQDLMDAFKDDEVKAIICAIGGDDSIRLLPYVDLEILKKHPKIFMGYSDTTVTHMMLLKAGLVSFYGPCIMCEFGEYVKMFDYTKEAVHQFLFEDCKDYKIISSDKWSKDHVNWDIKNMNVEKKMILEEHGYEILQGNGKVQGHLIGGCIDVFPMINGTSIWPSLDEWKDSILLIETSEEKPLPDLIKYYLRNLAAQGILKNIKGIIVGKPKEETYYEEYKEIFIQVMKEEQLESLPILYNVNIGHASPIGILPLGIQIEIDCDCKTLTIKEEVTETE